MKGIKESKSFDNMKITRKFDNGLRDTSANLCYITLCEVWTLEGRLVYLKQTCIKMLYVTNAHKLRFSMSSLKREMQIIVHEH